MVAQVPAGRPMACTVHVRGRAWALAARGWQERWHAKLLAANMPAVASSKHFEVAGGISKPTADTRSTIQGSEWTLTRARIRRHHPTDAGLLFS